MVSVLLEGGSWVRPDTVAPLAGLIRASQAGRGLRMREGSFLQQGLLLGAVLFVTAQERCVVPVGAMHCIHVICNSQGSYYEDCRLSGF